MISRRAFILASAGSLIASPTLAQIFTPRRGTALRKELLDAVRPIVEQQMRGPVEFVVRAMNVDGDAAFLALDPQRPGGAPIDVDETVFRDDADFMDGLTVYALLLEGSSGWAVAEHVTGPTDVAYADWPRLYNLPEAIIWIQ